MNVKNVDFFEPTIKYSDGTEDYISNYSVKTVPYDYKQIGIQRFSENYFKDKVFDLEKQLSKEKFKSCYWRIKAEGKEPTLIGSKKDIKYVFE